MVAKRVQRGYNINLTPILALPDGQIPISCSNPAIKVLTKESKSHFYIICINSSTDSVSARFDISRITKGKMSVSLMFEERDILINDKGCMKDNFAGYQRHVYVVPRSL